MKSLRILAIVPLLAFLVMPFWMSPALAETSREDYTNNLEAVGSEAYGSDVASNPDALPVMIGRLINQALMLLGIILLVIIIYAGVLWMTAGGNTESVDKAKKWLMNAVIGLVLVMASYAIANFVFNAILNGTTGT
jgi:hypothetical protein